MLGTASREEVVAVHAVCRFLMEEPRGLPFSEIQRRLTDLGSPPDEERLRRVALSESKADWLVMWDDAQWWLTHRGRAAFHEHSSPGDFHRAAVRLHGVWQESGSAGVERAYEPSWHKENPFLEVDADEPEDGDELRWLLDDVRAHGARPYYLEWSSNPFINALGSDLTLDSVLTGCPARNPDHIPWHQPIPTELQDWNALTEFALTSKERAFIAREGLAYPDPDHVWPQVGERTRRYLHLYEKDLFGARPRWPADELLRRDIREIVAGEMPHHLRFGRGRRRLEGSRLLQERLGLRVQLRPRSVSDPEALIPADFFHYGERCEEVIRFLIRADHMSDEDVSDAVANLERVPTEGTGDQALRARVSRLVEGSTAKWASGELLQGIVNGAVEIATGSPTRHADAVRSAWRSDQASQRLVLSADWTPEFGHPRLLCDITLELGPNADEFAAFYARTELLTRAEVEATMNEVACSATEYVDGKPYKKMWQAYKRVRKVVTWRRAATNASALGNDGLPEMTRCAMQDAGMAILARGLCADADYETVMRPWRRAEEARARS